VSAEVRRLQRLFREVNTRVMGINADQEAGQAEFLCECGRKDCIAAITLDLEEFTQVMGEQDVFIVAPDHGVEGVDRLLESREGYDLVTTRGR
jgi:hypothetical protein